MNLLKNEFDIYQVIDHITTDYDVLSVDPDESETPEFVLENGEAWKITEWSSVSMPTPPTGSELTTALQELIYLRDNFGSGITLDATYSAWRIIAQESLFQKILTAARFDTDLMSIIINFATATYFGLELDSPATVYVPIYCWEQLVAYGMTIRVNAGITEADRISFNAKCDELNVPLVFRVPEFPV